MSDRCGCKACTEVFSAGAASTGAAGYAPRYQGFSVPSAANAAPLPQAHRAERALSNYLDRLESQADQLGSAAFSAERIADSIHGSVPQAMPAPADNRDVDRGSNVADRLAFICEDISRCIARLNEAQMRSADHLA